MAPLSSFTVNKRSGRYLARYKTVPTTDLKAYASVELRLALKSAPWIELSQGMVCRRAFPKYRLQNPESLWQCVYLEAMEMPTWSLAVSFTTQVKNKQPRAFLATKENNLGRLLQGKKQPLAFVVGEVRWKMRMKACA